MKDEWQMAAERIARQRDLALVVARTCMLEMTDEQLIRVRKHLDNRMDVDEVIKAILVDSHQPEH